MGHGLHRGGLGRGGVKHRGGIFQSNPKAVLAYSSIGQMGIIMVGAGTGLALPHAWPALLPAVLVYALHHALAKGALFLSVIPAREASTRRQVLLARIGLLVPALALAGAPFTSGAVAKLALKSNLTGLPIAAADWLPFLLSLAAAGTTIKMMRFLVLVWPQTQSPAQPVTPGLRAPWLMLVSATLIAVWLMPGSLDWLLLKIEPAMLWKSAWPVLLGGLLAALGNLWLIRARGRATDAVPAGDMVVFWERIGSWLKAAGNGITAAPPAGESGVRLHPPGQASPASKRWRDRLAAAEQRLGSAEVAGTSIVLAMGVLILTLLL